MIFRTIVADDERPARERLHRLLESRPNYPVVAEADSGPKVVELVRLHRPDLLFLDVQMPGCTGLEALRNLEPAERPVVVFATAFDQYALDAFEANAIGYLLKPYTDERFEEALRRASQQVVGGRRDLWEGRLGALLEAASAGRSQYLERFAVKQRDRVLIVPVEEVDWIEAATDYLKLHRRGERLLVRSPLHVVAEQLDPTAFLRVHRSHIVRLDRVVSIESSFHGEDVLLLRDRSQVPVGRTYREAVRTRLGLGVGPR